MPTDVVVDASVGTKWFVSEADSGRAAGLLNTDWTLHVPRFFATEIASALVKLVRRKELGEVDANRALDELARMKLQSHGSVEIVAAALAAALKAGISVYDASYLAIAQQLGCRVVTADWRFFERASAHWPERMMWVEELEPVDDGP